MTAAFRPLPSAIDDLRDALGRLDRRIVRLLSEREHLQWEILAYKDARGIPLLDPVQEARVRQRARLSALRETGDPRLAEEVIVRAMRSGLARYADRWGIGALETHSAALPVLLSVPRPATLVGLTAP